MINQAVKKTKQTGNPPPNTRTFQAARLRRKHGLSETAARLIAALHFGEVA